MEPDRVVPSPRADLATVSVGDELVLHDPLHERTHRLGATAAVVWQCLDGQSTIGQIADDVVAVMGGDRRATVAELGRYVRRFARAGLLVGADPARAVPTDRASTPPDSAPPHRALTDLTPVPADPCARSNRFGWVGSLAVAVDGHLLGVRCNDAELLALLERLLAPVRVEASEPPPNFSLRRALPGRSRAHRLQEGCRTLVHSGSLRRTVTALCAFLSAYAAQTYADRVLVDAVAVVNGEEAMLLPERLRPRLGGAEQPLRDRGLAVADATPALTLDGGAVLVGPADLPVDLAALNDLPRELASPAAPPGRYRLAGWAWTSRSGGEASSAGAALTAADVVTAANRAVRNRAAVGAETTLRTLAAAVTRTGVAELPVGAVTTHAVLDALW